jgi:hypothetical protein
MSWKEISSSNVYIRKKIETETNYLKFHLRRVEKEEQIKSKVSKMKEFTKLRKEINETEYSHAKTHSLRSTELMNF